MGALDGRSRRRDDDAVCTWCTVSGPPPATLNSATTPEPIAVAGVDLVKDAPTSTPPTSSAGFFYGRFTRPPPRWPCRPPRCRPCRRGRASAGRHSAAPRSIARRMEAAASGSPRWSSIMAPAQIWPTGLAMPWPAMSGADPCTGSNSDGNSRSGFDVAGGRDADRAGTGRARDRRGCRRRDSSPPRRRTCRGSARNGRSGCRCGTCPSARRESPAPSPRPACPQ